MTRQPGHGSLWRDRGFTVFLTAQTLSVAGDSFALIAVLTACVASGATCLIIAAAALATPIRSRAERRGVTAPAPAGPR